MISLPVIDRGDEQARHRQNRSDAAQSAVARIVFRFRAMLDAAAEVLRLAETVRGRYPFAD